MEVRTITNFANSEIEIKKGEELTIVGIITDSSDTKKILKFKLTGEGAKLKCYLVTVGKDGKQNFETAVEHLAMHTEAEMIIKSVQLDSGDLNFTGMIVIPHQGEVARSFLRHDILLLSEEASARTIPALEIEAEDVKASHSASVGKLDEDEIFYLECRGFEKSTSEKMLVRAFFEEILGKFDFNEEIVRMKENLYSELKI